jgi:hypothetical protein
MIDFQVIPSAFVLLPAKDTDKRMIRMLKEDALKLGFELKTIKLMNDFEIAAINAFKFHFPHIIISCCFFYCSQSLYRHIVDCGLKQQLVPLG